MAPWFRLLALSPAWRSRLLPVSGGRRGPLASGTGSSPGSSRPTSQANPLFAVYQGRHDFDGRFPDWSDAGLLQMDPPAAPAAGQCGGVSDRQ